MKTQEQLTAIFESDEFQEGMDGVDKDAALKSFIAGYQLAWNTRTETNTERALKEAKDLFTLLRSDNKDGAYYDVPLFCERALARIAALAKETL